MRSRKWKLLIMFLCVLIAGFLIQQAVRSIDPLYDKPLWSNELRYFVAHDARQFDMNGAYGNPGTPVLELGSILTLFGISFDNAVVLSTNILVAVAAAACSIICFILRPDSLWWLATACTLLLNRAYPMATPPTMVVIPFITLVVLSSFWFLNEREVPTAKYFFSWGAVAGVALASRYEIALFVGVPFSLLIGHRHGMKKLLPMMAGMIFIFVLADPYMWFVPVRHLSDLVRRFIINYFQYPKTSLFSFSFYDTTWIAALSLIACLTLIVRKRLPSVLPAPAIIILAGMSLLLLIIVAFSNYKPLRYLFPLTVAWEVIFSLLVLEVVPSAQTVRSGIDMIVRRIVLSMIIGLLAVIQLSGSLVLNLQLLKSLRLF